MPTYDYACRSCGHVIEVVHGMTEAGPNACPRCDGELRRMLYPAGIIFKGSGFYSTDSRGSRAARSGKPASTEGSSGDAAPSTATSNGPKASDPAPAKGGGGGGGGPAE